jgi:hypothetical protein
MLQRYLLPPQSVRYVKRANFILTAIRASSPTAGKLLFGAFRDSKPFDIILIVLMMEAASTSETSTNFYHGAPTQRTDNHLVIKMEDWCLFCVSYYL